MAKKVSTLRGPVQLADLQGTLCVAAQYVCTGCHFFFLLFGVCLSVYASTLDL